MIIASQKGTVLKLTSDQARCIPAGGAAAGSGAVSAVTLSTTAMYIASAGLGELAAEQRVHGGVPGDPLDHEPGAEHALEPKAGSFGHGARCSVLPFRGDADPVDLERGEYPAGEQPDGPRGRAVAAGALREPVADLTAPLVALDAGDAHGAEQLVALGIDDQEVELLAGA